MANEVGYVISPNFSLGLVIGSFSDYCKWVMGWLNLAINEWSLWESPGNVVMFLNLEISIPVSFKFGIMLS